MKQRNCKKRPKKKHELFSNLPPEIIVNILSQLPVRTVVSCKCVCKSWLDLLETDEFAKLHHSKSVPGLAVVDYGDFQILEFEDVIDLERHELQCIPVTKFEIHAPIYEGHIHGSAHGLLFLYDKIGSFTSRRRDEPWILNPITREYIQIPCPQDFVSADLQISTYGFGASRITGQHKVVRIFLDCPVDESDDEGAAVIFYGSECQVYTLGTGLWRSITHGTELDYDSHSFGAFLNGNLHWLVFDINDCPLISCFDLEDEVFSIFPSPPTPPKCVNSRIQMSLVALEDYLCLRDCSSDDEFVIWLMKDYGDKKSWVKEYVISRSQIAGHIIAEVIKVFEDGFMAWGGDACVLYYSRRTKTAHEINFEDGDRMEFILHTPSFVSLKGFVNEKVLSF